MDRSVNTRALSLRPGQRLIAVSDIHGNLRLFDKLLDQVRYTPGSDVLVLAGDLIEKGPQSLDTLRFIMKLSKAPGVYALMGNCDFVCKNIWHRYNLRFLHQVLLSGGSVDARTLASRKGGDLSAAFRAGALAEAAALGDSLSAAGSGELTAFERACDDAVMAYLTRARRIPFGEQAVVGYLYARENEFTAIRTILSGRMAGLDADTIRERLREAYV